MTTLNAQINSTLINDSQDSNEIKITFSVWDGEDTAMVSFMGELSQSHACFLYENTSLSADRSAYAQMIAAFATCGSDEEVYALHDRVFQSVE